MTERVDFSRDAATYDRRHGAGISAGLVQRLCAVAGVGPGHRLLDIAAGTGRVAIPFAARGCGVVAFDCALPMFRTLLGKAADTSLRLINGDAANLPLVDQSFDTVVIARALYLMKAWRDVLRESARVLRQGGCLLHEWGNGTPDEEWVQIREELRRLLEEAGVLEPFHLGARQERDVVEALAELGFVEDQTIRAGGGTQMTLRRFLQGIQSAEYSYVWSVPADVKEGCLSKLVAWANDRFDLARVTLIPREVVWRVYKQP